MNQIDDKKSLLSETASNFLNIKKMKMNLTKNSKIDIIPDKQIKPIGSLNKKPLPTTPSKTITGSLLPNQQGNS